MPLTSRTAPPQPPTAPPQPPIAPPQPPIALQDATYEGIDYPRESGLLAEQMGRLLGRDGWAEAAAHGLTALVTAQAQAQDLRNATRSLSPQ